MSPTDLPSDSKPSASSSSDLYYKILTDSSKLQLLQSVIHFKLAEMLYESGPQSKAAIIEKLSLDSWRAEKWLWLLVKADFLEQNMSTGLYDFGKDLKLMFDDNHSHWWLTKELFRIWSTLAKENIVDFLQGGQPNASVHWSPDNSHQVFLLERRMRKTAHLTLRALIDFVNFNKAKRLLDVGGGDGTLACSLAELYKHLEISVYNLKEVSKLTEENILKYGVADRVKTHVGNFIEDSALPTGFDHILFCRVLCDWPEDITRKLLRMAYHALPEKGTLLICESFSDLHPDMAFFWEYRLFFIDHFAKGCFKTSEQYKTMLLDIGFSHVHLLDSNRVGVYQVITAQK